MKLIKEINEMAKKSSSKGPTINNLVAKHAQQMAGAGKHVEKKGKNAPRNKQKKAWKKEADREV